MAHCRHNDWLFWKDLKQMAEKLIQQQAAWEFEKNEQCVQTDDSEIDWILQKNGWTQETEIL